MPSTPGQRIKLLRISAGLSGAELGNALGVSNMAVSKWENDAMLPRSSKLIALAKELSTSIEFILRGLDGNADLLIRGVDLLQRDGEITSSRAAELKRLVSASVGEIG